MAALNVGNQEAFALERVTLMNFAEFQDTCRSILSRRGRVVGWMPHPENDDAILGVFAEDSLPWLTLFAAAPDNKTYPSFTNDFPQMHYFECELFETGGFIPQDHPWLRPVRKGSGNKRYAMYSVSGDDVHEVAVGPVHAGIIEPGHFRFQCHGENVLHLEIMLGYQHRGIERMMVSARPSSHMPLIESAAGDSVTANALAYAACREALAGKVVTESAEWVRGVALELERIAMHLSTLAGISLDIGFALANSLFSGLRTNVINAIASICGSRFGRGWIIPGGVRFGMSEETLGGLKDTLLQLRADARRAQKLLFASTGSVGRMDGTSPVSTAQAEELGLVGPVARASGIPADVRSDYPTGAYSRTAFSPVMSHRGDVYARAWVRCAEIESSIHGILEMIDGAGASGWSSSDRSEGLPALPRHAVVSLVEGFRGRITHFAATDSRGGFSAYKMTDPSFHNWYGLGLSMRGQQIFDFPLTNKSFDLSYCGHDL